MPDDRLPPTAGEREVAARRRVAARTALWLAGFAVLVYVAFILSGVLAA